MVIDYLFANIYLADTLMYCSHVVKAVTIRNDANDVLCSVRIYLLVTGFSWA